MNPKQCYRMTAWSLSLLGVLIFIFGNSLKPATASGAESGTLFSFLSEIFPFLTHHIVRKLAHFCEYALLGAHLAFTPLLLPTGTHLSYTVSFLFGAVVALLDEGIQTLVPGRAGMLSDALIDYAGYLFGVLLLLGMLFLYIKRKEKRLAKK